MKIKSIHIILVTCLATGCRSRPMTMQEQLTDNFKLHLKRSDSTSELISFKILRTDTITEKLRRIRDDSSDYQIMARIEKQLDHARKSNRADSVDFLLYEIRYIKEEIDSLEKAIATADVKKKYGIIVTCLFELKKDNRLKTDSMFYFINTYGQIVNSDMIDRFIQGGPRREFQY
jgi:hypothetical protein